jgi:mannosyltransferase
MEVKNWLKENYGIVGILVIAAILRLYHLDYQSVWLDELHTINEASPHNTLKEVYEKLMIAEPHPPLYFYIIHFLFKILGYSTIVLRSFSAIIGIVSIYAMFVFCKEMAGRKVGYLAAFLVTINIFHIKYSQDGRPYILLFLFSVVSFYHLIKYLKNPGYGQAIKYGFFAGLMSITHFFGLFALLSQYLILFLFFLLIKANQRKLYFLSGALAVVATFIIFIPAIPLFIQTASISDMWIELPTPTVYTEIFSNFFGKSELVISIVYLAVILYVVKISRAAEEDLSYDRIITRPDLLIFITTACWIFMVLLVPLIRTYTNLPMIVDRYFITILPAIILLTAIGFYSVKNHVVRGMLIAMLCIFSITDIFIVKKYYHAVSKSQVRELSQYLIYNTAGKDLLVSALGWYFPFFLHENNRAQEIYEVPLNEYLDAVRKDSTQLRSFWYADFHGRSYEVNEMNQEFLDKYFTVDDEVQFLDAWAKHYQLGKIEFTLTDISSFNLTSTTDGDPMKSWIDDFEQNGDHIRVRGWAYFENQDAQFTNIDVLLIAGNVAYEINSKRQVRNDITKSNNGKYNLDLSGFSALANLNSLPPGTYNLAIRLSDKNTVKSALIVHDKSFIKN